MQRSLSVFFATLSLLLATIMPNSLANTPSYPTELDQRLATAGMEASIPTLKQEAIKLAIFSALLEKQGLALAEVAPETIEKYNSLRTSIFASPVLVAMGLAVTAIGTESSEELVSISDFLTKMYQIIVTPSQQRKNI